MSAQTNVQRTIPTQIIRRSAIENEIERLIALLDGFDGNPDCEDIGDFEDGGDLEPDVDGEPSLAALETKMRPLYWHSRILPIWLGGEPGDFLLKCSNGDQTSWSAGDCADMEMEEGNDEPDVDDEPSLGWVTTSDGGHTWPGSTDDLEVGYQ